MSIHIRYSQWVNSTSIYHQLHHHYPDNRVWRERERKKTRLRNKHPMTCLELLSPPYDHRTLQRGRVSVMIEVCPTSKRQTETRGRTYHLLTTTTGRDVSSRSNLMNSWCVQHLLKNIGKFFQGSLPLTSLLFRPQSGTRKSPWLNSAASAPKFTRERERQSRQFLKLKRHSLFFQSKI